MNKSAKVGKVPLHTHAAGGQVEAGLGAYCFDKTFSKVSIPDVGHHSFI